MIICNKCGNAIGDASNRFCIECGADAIAPQASAMDTTIAIAPPQIRSGADSSAPLAEVLSQPVTQVPTANIRPRVFVSIGSLVIIVIVVIGVTRSRSNSTQNLSNSNTDSSVSHSNLNATRPGPSYRYPNGHWAVCKFTPVHIRTSPSLNASIITDIAAGDRVWIISESSNYDTVHINSLEADVTDNWSEVELENSSAHGWVFSAFIR